MRVPSACHYAAPRQPRPAACVETSSFECGPRKGPELTSHAHHVRRIRVRPHEVAASPAFTHGLALATKPAPPVAADGTDEALCSHVSQCVPAGCGSPPRCRGSPRRRGAAHPERRGPLHCPWSMKGVSRRCPPCCRRLVREVPWTHPPGWRTLHSAVAMPSRRRASFSGEQSRTFTGMDPRQGEPPSVLSQSHPRPWRWPQAPAASRPHTVLSHSSPSRSSSPNTTP